LIGGGVVELVDPPSGKREIMVIRDASGPFGLTFGLASKTTTTVAP
jgi:hypothetical protein